MMKTARIFITVIFLVSIFSGILHAQPSADSENIAAAPASTEFEAEAEDNIIPTEEAENQSPTKIQVSPAGDASPSAEIAGGGYEFPLLRAIGGFGLVLCLMIILFFAGRKLFPRYFKKTDSEKRLKVIETLAMGDKRSISLLQVGDKVFLVGNTPDQINLLTPVSDALHPDSEMGNEITSDKSAVSGLKNNSFRNMYEAEKTRTAAKSGSPLPDDVRTKMRLLREALER